VLDQVFGACLVIGGRCVILEHELDELALHQERREPGKRQHEIALVHGAQALEQLAALLVDHGSHRVGKVRQPAIRVVWRGTTHRIDMDHPAGAQAAQGLVDAVRHQVTLLDAGAGVVLALISPSRHESAVLAHDHALVHHRGVVQQIGQSRVSRAVAVQPAPMPRGANATIEHDKEQDADRGDEQDQETDQRIGHHRRRHRYCRSCVRPLWRNGVARGA